MEEKHVQKPEELSAIQLELTAGGTMPVEYQSRIYCRSCEKYITYHAGLEPDYLCPKCSCPLFIK